MAKLTSTKIYCDTVTIVCWFYKNFVQECSASKRILNIRTYILEMWHGFIIFTKLISNRSIKVWWPRLTNVAICLENPDVSSFYALFQSNGGIYRLIHIYLDIFYLFWVTAHIQATSKYIWMFLRMHLFCSFWVRVPHVDGVFSSRKRWFSKMPSWANIF